MIEIKKSKFYSYKFEVTSREMIDEILCGLKKDHKKSTHIAYAYILSNPYEEKFNDDKEPCRTAGFPILNILKKKGLENILVVVVRYYGGIKLGVGGLIRAYTKSALENLA